VVPSASLVPANDPTLLFTNAGMNQFKDVFLETGTRPYRRAVDTQKCLRVSGKHNDLEEVGIDTYHHTFFEMLGNWSFGDYFKKEAVRWAWELLVDRWGLDPDRIYVTVHGGDRELGLEADEEAAELWRTETPISADHVMYFGSEDNFWMMGETGPCGPCSEVHYDRRPDGERVKQSGAELVNAIDPRVIEIWNLVFIQYDARPDGSLKQLSAKHVDTGMGFERIVAVLQGKSSNYDTDLFEPLLSKIAEICPRKDVDDYALSQVDDADERERLRIAMRVIADHIRTIVFAAADGATPSNVGRGYVIRRILRRAVRFGYQSLDFREAFLHRLVSTLVGQMSDVFPEIRESQDYVERLVEAEENAFLETLGNGIKLFETIVPYVERAAGGASDRVQASVDLREDRRALEILENSDAGGNTVDLLIDDFIRTAGANRLPGQIAFLLHDTYGFPVDLTQLMARERGIDVEMERYEACMEQQRDRARSASTFTTAVGGDWTIVSKGDDDSRFVGYELLNVDDAAVRAVRRIDVDAGNGAGSERFEVVLDRTPFYAEAGGQVGDRGAMIIGGETVRVLDTYRVEGRVAHVVDQLPADIDGPVSAAVDADWRTETAKHHSATHLLHAALREELGPHVTQKGSLVAPGRLRFDFNHFERVPAEQLARITARVNEYIQRNVPRGEERDVPVDEALAHGAMALFGEKYGDRVRVITFDPEYSVELCGGTHAGATGELGLFEFLSEGSVASGVRRVEAVVGAAALEYVHGELGALNEVRNQFKALQQPVELEVAKLVERVRSLERESSKLRQSSMAQSLDGFIDRASRAGDIRVVVGRTEPAGMDELRVLGQELRERMGKLGVGVLGSVDPAGEKVYLVSAVTQDLVERGLNAGSIVGRIAKVVGGGGGGRPDLATAGGRLPDNLDKALESVVDVVNES